MPDGVIGKSAAGDDFHRPERYGAAVVRIARRSLSYFPKKVGSDSTPFSQLVASVITQIKKKSMQNDLKGLVTDCDTPYGIEQAIGDRQAYASRNRGIG